MGYSNTSPELREKAKACESVDELIKLAETEGIELSDEQLEQVTGGSSWNSGCYLSRTSA